ncbi:sigma-70 family RNA polymerase sigma factor [Terriglobus sp. RCC_193]|uniref:sigma-70 family RNA polymerase sigma factor n=1 Tax=Terriglobus sp. RCC_193 TaxID=3239218 RepID=UPI003526499A
MLSSSGGYGTSHSVAAMPVTTKLDTLLEHRGQFLAFLERRVHDRNKAEDILQAAYIRALEHEGNVQEHESVVGWFYRVLRNAVIDSYRRHSVENEGLALLAREMEDAVTSPVDLRDEVCLCLQSAVDSLSPDYAELLREVDLADEPLTAYAQKRSLTSNNAAVRAHRARAALRKELLRSCGACAEHHCEVCTCKRC